jgi:lipoyl(octanoyl) transferase
VSQSCLVINSGACPPAFNMALDEALLESVIRLNAAVLRFYGWQEPAATFGYFQKYREVSAFTELRPLIRRPTGGGLVPHASDWTYCLSIPPSAEWYSLRAIESYRRMHEWIRAGLASLGVDAMLATDCNPSGPGQCFEGYEKFDVLSRGRKIAGAAQRRAKMGLLIQGSVQPVPFGIDREQWHQAMARTSEEAGFTCIDAALDGQTTELANKLRSKKYSLTSYNEKR